MCPAAGAATSVLPSFLARASAPAASATSASSLRTNRYGGPAVGDTRMVRTRTEGKVTTQGNIRSSHSARLPCQALMVLIASESPQPLLVSQALHADRAHSEHASVPQPVGAHHRGPVHWRAQCAEHLASETVTGRQSNAASGGERAPSLSSKKTPLRWMKRRSLCSATIVHWASCLGRPVSGRAMQYSKAVPIQPRFSCAISRAGSRCQIPAWS